MTEQLFEACIARIRDGDQSALKEIYEAYASYIYSIAYHVLGNKTDAEDVTSDFFLRIWYTAEKFQKGRGHKAYLATITRNMCIDFLRKRGREISKDMSGADEMNENEIYQQNLPVKAKKESTAAAQTTGGFEEELVSNMTLRDAINTLSPPQREIINLKIGADLTFREVADVLKLSMGTVTWRYREAIKKLRRCGFYEESEK